VPGTPYWSRSDLGISSADISRQADGVHVRVHSMGSVAAPASKVMLRDSAGNIIATVPTPALAAPNDLHPKTADVVLKVPAGTKLDSATLVVDPDNTLGEITTLNNSVSW
jgi:hypothetical protein